MCAPACPKTTVRWTLPDSEPMNRPNFLVIGAQRAGTTLLHRLLATHPEVYVPFQRKELHYFDRYFERGDAWYAGYFPAEPATRRYLAVGEVTPDYLAHPQAPRPHPRHASPTAA